MKILLSALVLASLPGLAMAMCAGHVKATSDCPVGEIRDTSGQCMKPVHG